MISLNTLKDIESNEKIVEVELQNGSMVSVNTKLPFQKKTEIVEDIVNECAIGDIAYVNPMKLKVLASLKVIDNCTNIVVFEDNELNIYEIYDILDKASVFDDILHLTEYEEIYNLAYYGLDSLIRYNNSVIGVLEDLKERFNSENLMEEFNKIKEEVENNPNLTALLNLYETDNVAN